MKVTRYSSLEVPVALHCGIRGISGAYILYVALYLAQNYPLFFYYFKSDWISLFFRKIYKNGMRNREVLTCKKNIVSATTEN